MKLTKEERTKLTYEIGDIIEQECRRCVYNKSSEESFNVTVCPTCPTGVELLQLGRYSTWPKEEYASRIDAGICSEVE